MLAKSGTNLVNLSLTVASGGVLTVTNRFNTGGTGEGVEVITFSDGVRTEVLAGPLGQITTTGTATGQTHNGWAFRDEISGLGGNDTINGNAGDDTLIGGDGIDSLDGGAGSDVYRWKASDKNDVINDTAVSQSETDILRLEGISVTDVALTRASGSNDLFVNIASTGEAIRIVNRFASTSQGVGIEGITFDDGTTWLLDELLARTRTNGAAGAANDSLSGSAYRDNIYGLAGNDTLNGQGGNDDLFGGTGVDLLLGGTSTVTATNGNDRYFWAKGDGNDTITDTATSTSELDRLILTDVLPGEVQLRRAATSTNLQVQINNGVDGLITVTNRFKSTIDGTGIEAIEFRDGTVWMLEDILARTEVYGGNTTPDSLAGTAWRDNLFGLGGNDTLSGNDGDDRLVGGAGDDLLWGGATTGAPVTNGNDTYIWAKGDGSDEIRDWGQSLTESDTLELTNVISAEVSLTYSNGVGADLLITILPTTEVIRVDERFQNPAWGYGIERIVFSDGETWTLDDILEHTSYNGTSGADNLTGTGYRDKIYAKGGNDTIAGGAGDDLIQGEGGADSMNGGAGIDVAGYKFAPQGVSVDLAITTAQPGITGGHEVGDVLAGFEGLLGSNFGDTLKGDDNSNVLTGLAGNDSLLGRDGFDELFGDDGNDTLFGGLGSDDVNGGGQNDLLYGDEGNDTLDGGTGNDTLYGGAGDDTLVGGWNTDVLYGGSGTDTFVFRDDVGTDTIEDFSAVIDRDVIDLSYSGAIDSFADLIANHLAQVGSDVSISDGIGGSILVRNVLIADLHSWNFVV